MSEHSAWKTDKKQNTRNDYNSNESQFCHFILVHPLQLVQAHEDHAVHVVWGTKPVNLILWYTDGKMKCDWLNLEFDILYIYIWCMCMCMLVMFVSCKFKQEKEEIKKTQMTQN